MAELAAELVPRLLLLLGALLTALGAVGVTRFPDPLLRVQALAKASALGAGLFALAIVAAAPSASARLRALALLGFTLVTGPLGGQALARAAYRARTGRAGGASRGSGGHGEAG